MFYTLSDKGVNMKKSQAIRMQKNVKRYSNQ